MVKARRAVNRGPMPVSTAQYIHPTHSFHVTDNSLLLTVDLTFYLPLSKQTPIPGIRERRPEYENKFKSDQRTIVKVLRLSSIGGDNHLSISGWPLYVLQLGLLTMH